MKPICNREILFLLSLFIYIVENQWFGWNRKPMSFAEAWWDNLVINLFVFSLFVKKVYLRQEKTQ